MIILQMVTNMNETQLCTIEQIEQFLSGSASIEFSTAGNDSERYAHISRVLKRFDYPAAASVIAVCCAVTWSTPAATAERKLRAWWLAGRAIVWRPFH